MTESTREIVEPTSAYPPRFWWLKRIVLIIALMVAAFFVVRAIAVHRALREFEEEVALLKSKGEPTDSSAFSQPVIADGQNAATDAQARAALTRLIQDLLDDQVIDDWTLRSIAEERVMMIQGLQHSVIDQDEAGHDLYDRAFVFAFRAPLIGKTVRQVRGFDEAADAARKSTYPSGLMDYSYLRYRPIEDSISRRWSSFNNHVGTPDGWVSQRRRQITWRRMYAAALAIRMYQADYDGSFPATLDELVPRYLDRVPIDLYDNDGKPLQYMTHPKVMIFYHQMITYRPMEGVELLGAPPPTQPSVTNN